MKLVPPGLSSRTTLEAADSARQNLSIIRLLRPHSRGLTIGIVAVIVEGIANLAEPWPLKIVLDNVLKAKSAQGWLNQLILSAAGTEKLAILKFAALAVLAIAAIGAICSYTEKYITTNLGQWVMHDLRHQLYSHIQRLSLGFHDRKQTGDLISRLTSDIDAIQSFIASGLLGALMNSLTLVGMIAVMFYINSQFTWIALSVAPVLFLVVFHFTRRIKKATRDVRKKEGEMVSVIQEVLSSMRVVKAFGREDYEQRRMAEESRESLEIALRVRGLKVRLSPLVDMITAVGTCLVLWFGGRMALAGSLSVGSLVLFIWYLGRMYKPMRELSKMSDAYSKAAIGYERIREVLETEHEIRDLPGARRAPAFRGSVELSDVSFAYEPHYPILKQVSLKVEPGQMVALVGPTGAGKTTIINLIPRFYDPDTGRRQNRRHGCETLPAAISPPADQFRIAGDTAVSRAHLVQHRLREAGGQPRRDSESRASGQCARIHRADAARLRHGHRRTRRDPFGRSAPAARHCPSGDSRHPDPDPR